MAAAVSVIERTTRAAELWHIRRASQFENRQNEPKLSIAATEFRRSFLRPLPNQQLQNQEHEPKAANAALDSSVILEIEDGDAD
jgi:hypothetical protein